MSDTDPKIIKVVEIDPDRLRKMEQDLADMKLEGAVKKTEMGTLQKGMTRLDEAFFGNGKAGFKQDFAEFVARFDNYVAVLEDVRRIVNGYNEKGVFSTQKIKAITQEAIEKEAGKPGTWQAFVKQWGMPILFIILSSIVGGYIGHTFWP